MNDMGPTSDPFAPVTDLERDAAKGTSNARGRRKAKDSEPVEVMIWPENGSPPLSKFRHSKYGMPAAAWFYCDPEGGIYAAAVRHDTPMGPRPKEVLRWTFGRLGGRVGWHPKAAPKPWALYKLDALAAMPDMPALITEGEKAADAGGNRFPETVATTCIGGCQAPQHADWTPLAGRPVIIWPDNDNAGRKYAAGVRKLALDAGAASVRIVNVPNTWPNGWDLADDLPEGVTADDLRRLFDGAEEPRQAADASDAEDELEEPAEGAAPNNRPHYEMRADGLYHIIPVDDDNPREKRTKITPPFEIVASACDGMGAGWGLVLRWRDARGNVHTWGMPQRLCAKSGSELAEELLERGLKVGIRNSQQQHLRQYLASYTADRHMTAVEQPGWHATEKGDAFVLASGDIFGPAADDVYLLTDRAARSPAYRPAGQLADWQVQVGRLAVGNDHFAFFVAAALAGPLMMLMDEQSGGVHLVGPSRCGKTTALMMGASVWGRAASSYIINRWKATANGLEAIAAASNDTVLILDEISQARADEVGAIIYMIGNGAGKQRAGRSGGVRTSQHWRTLLLSTGEKSLAAKMAEGGEEIAAGQEGRLLSIPADADDQFGIVQQLHGFATSQTLIDHIGAWTQKTYGTAGREFLRKLTEKMAADRKALVDDLANRLALFRHEFTPENAGTQVRSAIDRFALIALAGELATAWSVLPWSEGEATRASGACLRAWLAARGDVGQSEDQKILQRVRLYFEQYGDSRFIQLDQDELGSYRTAPDRARPQERAGFRATGEVEIGTDKLRQAEFWVLPGVWLKICGKDSDTRRANKLLNEHGLLILAKGRGEIRHKIRIDGLQVRVIRIAASILGDI